MHLYLANFMSIPIGWRYYKRPTIYIVLFIVRALPGDQDVNIAHNFYDNIVTFYHLVQEHNSLS